MGRLKDVLKLITSKIADLLIDDIFKMPTVDLSKIQANPLKKTEDALPKMDELLAAGVVKTGDLLYITVAPENSQAELIDSKYVKYNGEKGAKENGKLRLEGKEYEMQDGDVVLFRFNV